MDTLLFYGLPDKQQAAGINKIWRFFLLPSYLTPWASAAFQATHSAFDFDVFVADLYWSLLPGYSPLDPHVIRPPPPAFYLYFPVTSCSFWGFHIHESSTDVSILHLDLSVFLKSTASLLWNWNLQVRFRVLWDIWMHFLHLTYDL